MLGGTGECGLSRALVMVGRVRAPWPPCGVAGEAIAWLWTDERYSKVKVESSRVRRYGCNETKRIR